MALELLTRWPPRASSVPTAPPSWMHSARSLASARRSRQRWSAAAQRAIFTPAVIGVAGRGSPGKNICVMSRPLTEWVRKSDVMVVERNCGEGRADAGPNPP
jgi:hypothetical protein